MDLNEIIPDAEVVIALEPEELAIRLLPMLIRFPPFENRDLETLIAKVCGDPRIGSDHPSGRGVYGGRSRAEMTTALREAWAWLEGAALLLPDPRYRGSHGVRVLSRKALKLAQEPDPLRAFSARRLHKDALHPSIREDVWALYHRGKFETAIIEAMKAVEVAVRKAGGFTNSDYGKDMVARAFNAKNGPLRDENAEASEREALFQMMTGAFALYRNPYAHRHVGQDDPDEAAEIIMLASHLLRIVDKHAAQKTVP